MYKKKKKVVEADEKFGRKDEVELGLIKDDKKYHKRLTHLERRKAKRDAKAAAGRSGDKNLIGDVASRAVHFLKKKTGLKPKTSIYRKKGGAGVIPRGRMDKATPTEDPTEIKKPKYLDVSVKKRVYDSVKKEDVSKREEYGEKAKEGSETESYNKELKKSYDRKNAERDKIIAENKEKDKKKSKKFSPKVQQQKNKDDRVKLGKRKLYRITKKRYMEEDRLDKDFKK